MYSSVAPLMYLLFFKSNGVRVFQPSNAKSLIKGVRGPVDYDYEAQMAGMNTVMCPDLETIFLMSKPEFSFIHSSLVKQISLMGGDVTGFVSQSIKNQLKTKS